MMRGRVVALAAGGFACWLAASCGARTDLPGGASRGDAAPDAPATRDATVLPGDAAPDQAPLDSMPLDGPCHLVQDGSPVVSLEFSDANFGFHQDGVLARTGTGMRGAPLVQYGNVSGQRTGVWQDNPIYAVEYDVSQWPPLPLREPSQLFHSMHAPLDLLELGGNKLGLVFYYDNDGGGPNGVRFRSLDKLSWQLDQDVMLVPEGRTFKPPALVPGTSYFAVAYQDLNFESFVGFFDHAGREAASALSFMSDEDAGYTSWKSRPSLVATRTHLLLADALRDCTTEDGGTTCTGGELVVFRVEWAGQNPRLVETMRRMPAGSGVPKDVRLLSDAAGHNWLAWWNEDTGSTDYYSTSTLLAVPLSDAGDPMGEIEEWGKAELSFRRDTIGPLGVVAPVGFVRPKDGGSEWDVSLIHRQSASTGIETVSVTTISSAHDVSVAQIAEPRSVIVGYSTKSDGVPLHGELRRFRCLEDLGKP